MVTILKNNYLFIAVIAIIVGAVAFIGGVKYQQSKQPTFIRQFSGNGVSGRGQFLGGANRQGFRPLAGEIVASDAGSISVKLQDGGSKLVLISESTDINKANKSTKDDLKIGEQVAVFGTENTDGSITAQTIQLNPLIRGLGTTVSGTPR